MGSWVSTHAVTESPSTTPEEIGDSTSIQQVLASVPFSRWTQLIPSKRLKYSAAIAIDTR